MRKSSQHHTSPSLPISARPSMFCSDESDGSSTGGDVELEVRQHERQSFRGISEWPATSSTSSIIVPSETNGDISPQALAERLNRACEVPTKKKSSCDGRDPIKKPPGQESRRNDPWSSSVRQLLRAAKRTLSLLWIFLTVVTLLYFHLCGESDLDSASRHGLRGATGMGLPAMDGKQFHPDQDGSTPPILPVLRPPSSRYHIPLPLPEQKISVVLMNYSRPRMIRESSMMRTLLAHPNIDEIVILHSNPKTAFKFSHPKVINIDATKENDEIGLSLRFYFCQFVKNDWVIHVDDDMEFTRKSLSEMIIEFARNTRRIVGRYGRDRKEGNFFNGYSSKNTHKESEVILTKLMIMERNMCSSFFEHAHLVWEDTVLHNGEGPLWNGEDIFMSLVANRVYGGSKVNYAMDWLDVWSAPESLKDYDNGKLDISGGQNGLRFWDWQWWQSLLRRNRHYSYRGTLWETAKARLAQISV